MAERRFDAPDRFVAGTVGEPGARSFYLQARQDTRLVSVAVEKQQVALLADRVEELLDEVAEGAPMAVPAMAPLGLVDNDPLEMPIDEEFRAGTMTLSWDPAHARLVIEIYAFDDGLDSGEYDEVVEIIADETPDVVTVSLTPGAARAFTQRSQQVVGAGRPQCPFCGAPVDPKGHLCPRANGFKRRDP